MQLIIDIDPRTLDELMLLTGTADGEEAVKIAIGEKLYREKLGMMLQTFADVDLRQDDDDDFGGEDVVLSQL